jgi:hypothetical protein
MFDVRSLLDQLLRGDPRSQDRRPPPGSEDLADLLAQLAPHGRARRTTRSWRPAARRRCSGQQCGLAFARRRATGGRQPRGGPTRPVRQRPPGPPGWGREQRRRGGLGDLLGTLQRQAAQGSWRPPRCPGELSWGRRPPGRARGSGRLDEATGGLQVFAPSYREDDRQNPRRARCRAQGAGRRQSLGRRRGAGGGLGALVLGMQAGRSLAATAAKLGGLAMLGGLAYKA